MDQISLLINPQLLIHPPSQRQSNLHDISAYDFLQANMHSLDPTMSEDTDVPLCHNPPDDDHDQNATLLVNAAKSSGRNNL